MASKKSSLSNQLIYQHLNGGKSVDLLMTVPDVSILKEILTDSSITRGFFERVPGKYNFWSEDDTKRELNITLKKSQEQISVKITPILTKKKDGATYSGYIPSFFLINFIVDLRIGTNILTVK